MREREGERERGGEKVREGGRKREREREKEGERVKERERGGGEGERCFIEVAILFLHSSVHYSI